MRKNIILMGPPGSGKGTQAKNLAKYLNYTYFGMGDLIREEIEKDSKLGQKIKLFVEKGQLIDDQDISQILLNNIVNHQEDGIIFDGFPRSLDQAHILEKILPNIEFLIINIQVRADSLLKRMEKRRICADCDKIFIIDESEIQKKCDVCGGVLIRRSDDKPEILTERVGVYENQSKPLIDYYGQNNVVINIDGEPPIEDVEKELITKINEQNID